MENTIKHTPGPWTLIKDGVANFCGVTTPKKWLLRIQQNGELLRGEQEANARLIASAPELLEACRLAKTYLEFNGGLGKMGITALKACNDAISKAEGR